MILGVDPGLASCGWAVLANRDRLLDCGCIVTKKNDDLGDRLNKIYHQVKNICQDHKVEELAIESLFFAKNTKTALVVAQVIGVVKAAAFDVGAGAFEYTPLQIKVAITGYGRAEKNQVAAMIKESLGDNGKLANNHTADAAAAALTHLFTMKKEILT